MPLLLDFFFCMFSECFFVDFCFHMKFSSFMHDHNINTDSFLFASHENVDTIHIPLLHDELSLIEYTQICTRNNCIHYIIIVIKI